MINRRHFAVGASLVALAACQPNPSTQNGPGTPLRFQASWINDAEFMGYFVAMDREFDFYNKAGLRLDYKPGGPQVIPETSLLTNAAEIALTTPETTAKYITRDGVDFVIVGAQYQKNPIGIVSLARHPINTPHDLIGKRLAVAPVNQLTVEAMLRMNSIDPGQVTLVPYTYDPQILISGAADATVDFATNVPYTLHSMGHDAHSFLLYDAGFKVFNDTVVVERSVLDARMEDVARFLAASMLGWEENYRAAEDAYARRYASTHFQGNGRQVENEIEFNRNQRPLMEHPDGFFAMTDEAIADNIRSLEVLDLHITPDVFDTRPLARAREIRQHILHDA